MNTKRLRGVGKRIWAGLRGGRAASRRRFQLELLESRWVFDGDGGALANEPIDSEAPLPLVSLESEVAIVAEGVLGETAGLEPVSFEPLQVGSGVPDGIALMTAMAFSEAPLDYAAPLDYEGSLEAGGFRCGSVDASATIDQSLANLMQAFADIDFDQVTEPVVVEEVSNNLVDAFSAENFVGELLAEGIPVETSSADVVFVEVQEVPTETIPIPGDETIAPENRGAVVVDGLAELQHEIVETYEKELLRDPLLPAEEALLMMEPCAALASVAAWAANEGWTEEWATTEFDPADGLLDELSTTGYYEAPVDENGVPISPPLMLRTSLGWVGEISGLEGDVSTETGFESVSSDEDFPVYAFSMPVEDGGEPIALPMLFTKTSLEDGTNPDEPTYRVLSSEEDGLVYALGMPVDESGEPLLTGMPTDGDAELFITSQPMSGSADPEMVNWVLTSWGWTGVEPSEVNLWVQADGEDVLEVHTLAVYGAEWDFVVVDGEPQFLAAGDNLFHNSQLPADTNGDGEPTPIDILVIYNYLNAGHFHQLPNRVHQPDRIRYVDVDGSRTVSLEDAEALYPVLTMAGATSLVEGAGDSSASAARLAAPAAPVIEGSFPTSELPTSELPAISEDALVLVDELVPVDARVPEGAFVSEEPMRKVATGGEEAFDADHNPDGSETGTVSDGLSSADLPALERFPSGLVGFDHATVMLDAEATAFPVIEVDYSANDTIMGATLVGVSKPQWGQVEWFADAGLEGRPVLRYTPGPEFSGHDSFTYTVADEEGFEWTGHVNVQVEQERTAFSPFTVTAPAEPLTLSGESLDFVSAEGEPLLQVAYDGLASVTGSLYLAWVSGIQEDAQEVFAGSLSLRSDSELEGWNSLSNGSAWMTGSIAELNAALGQLVYAPAQGFTAPGGVTLVVHVALQSTLGLWVNDTFATMEVIVPAGPGGPIAVGDSFTLEGSGTEFRLDVLANDLPATDAADSMLELVGLTPSPYSPAVIRLDAEMGQVVYQVDPSISVIYDTFAYVLRDSQGRVSQGQVTIALNATAKTEPEEALVVVEEGSVESFEDDLLSASLSQDEAS